jgi:hypothetical protein
MTPPLTIKFDAPLTPEQYAALGKEMFLPVKYGEYNMFGLWGHPISLGPTKCHTYGVDRMLNQPINIELTQYWISAIIPSGDQGEAAYRRLVKNLDIYRAQHYWQNFPRFQAWIGKEKIGEALT